MKSFFPLVVLFLFFSACIFDTNLEEPSEIGEVEGLRPVYVNPSEWQDIESTAVKAIQQLGKIYYKSGKIYVTEKGKGIHVIDNADPANPEIIQFLQIPGCRDIAIKGNILYADNVTDLVAIDISDLDEIKVTKRIKDLYSQTDQLYPEAYEGYFECVNTELGMVIGWEPATLNNPECRR